jgi:hypothetical protein
MNLAEYLSELIGRYDEVSVPGLGYFVRERVNGRYDEQEGKLYPPFHEVKFVPEPKNDDTFAQHVADKKHISLASSRYFTEKFVGKIREQAATGRYPIADLGSFQAGDNHELVFVPSDTILADADFYGFEPIGISKKERITPSRHIETFGVAPVEEPVAQDAYTEPVDVAAEEPPVLQDSVAEDVEISTVEDDAHFDTINATTPHAPVEQEVTVEDAPIEEPVAADKYADPVETAAEEASVLQDQVEETAPVDENKPVEAGYTEEIIEQQENVEDFQTEELVAENSYAETIEVIAEEPLVLQHQAPVVEGHEETALIESTHTEEIIDEYADAEGTQTEQKVAETSHTEPVEIAQVEPSVFHDAHDEAAEAEPIEQHRRIDPFEEALAKALAEMNAYAEETSIEHPVAENAYAEPVAVTPAAPPVFHEAYVAPVTAEQPVAQNEYAAPFETVPAEPHVAQRPVSPYLENPVYYYGDEVTTKDRVFKILKIVLIILIVALVAFGIYQFFSSAFERLFIQNHGATAAVADKIDTLSAKATATDTNSVKDSLVKTGAAITPAAVRVDTSRPSGYTIVLERFKKQAKVDEEVARFNSIGVAARALTRAEITGPRLKVAVGVYPTYNEAEAAKRALIKAGKISRDSQILQLKTQK